MRRENVRIPVSYSGLMHGPDLLVDDLLAPRGDGVSAHEQRGLVALTYLKWPSLFHTFVFSLHTLCCLSQSLSSFNHRHLYTCVPSFSPPIFSFILCSSPWDWFFILFVCLFLAKSYNPSDWKLKTSSINDSTLEFSFLFALWQNEVSEEFHPLLLTQLSKN